MTHFLIDASLPRPTAGLIRSLGHQATDVRDIGMAIADDEVIAKHARSNKLCLITRDLDFGNVRDYPPEAYAGIVVIRTPEQAGRSVVLNMIERFLREEKIVCQLPGHLVVVERTRIRLRPA